MSFPSGYTYTLETLLRKCPLKGIEIKLTTRYYRKIDDNSNEVAFTRNYCSDSLFCHKIEDCLYDVKKESH